MNTKNILLLIGLLLCASGAAAQTNFFNVTRTFHENGFTYQADVLAGEWVVLYNRANRFTNVRQGFTDGSPLNEFIVEREGDVERTTEVHAKLLAQYLIRNAFSAAERNRLREGEVIFVTLRICPHTGNIIDVEFEFLRQQSYATIPVSTWRRLELALKEQVRFTPTTFARNNLNFIFRSVRVDVVEQVRLHGVTGGPPPSPPPGDPPPGSGPGIGWIDDDDPPIGPIGPMRGEDPLEEEEEILEET